MSWSWKVFLVAFGLALLLVFLNRIGNALLAIWTPGESSVPGIALRVVLFGLAFLFLWLWLPLQF